MNSRERVLAAFHKVKADRVPINAFFNGGIFKRMCDFYKCKDQEELFRALGVDFRIVQAGYTGKSLFPAKEGRHVDPLYGYYTKWVEHGSGGYWDFCDFPLQGADFETIYNFPVPNPDDFAYDYVDEQIKMYKDYALHVGTAGMADIINSTGRVMGMEDTLVNLATEDEATLHYIKRRCEFEVGLLQRIIERAKGRIDFMWIGEDLGSQHKPMISLNTYRKVLKPFHKMYVDLAKSYNLPVMVHTCGSSSWVYEDFIEMGIDAVDTLQPEATNMSPEYLVEHFGGRLSFHGCLSTAGALAYGSKEDVRREVEHIMEIMKPTFSYMFSPTHAIQDNSPTENVVEAYRAAKELGKY